MSDKIDRAEQLANKLLNKTISAEEELELDLWYNQHLDDQIILPGNFVSSEKEHRERILAAIRQQTGLGKTVRLWPRIAIAAAVLVVAFGIGLLYFGKAKNTNLQETVYANDIAPGRVGATLILANGKKIRLSDASIGELAKEAGVRIDKTANGQIVYTTRHVQGGTTERSVSDRSLSAVEMTDKVEQLNTLSTAKGETYVVTLPDGSKVWLNAASSLTYKTTLNESGKRRVKLSGEAYFQVAKDKKHPFIVESTGQDVQVLGTHFNINSYTDEAMVKTTLLEGSVRVHAFSRNYRKNQNDNIILKPGEQSSVSGKQIRVAKVDALDVVAWKDGKFLFQMEPVESIMRKLARWYDVEIVYEGNIKNETIWGSVSRYKNVSQVLDMLSSTKVVKFTIDGRKITVMPYKN